MKLDDILVEFRDSTKGGEYYVSVFFTEYGATPKSGKPLGVFPSLELARQSVLEHFSQVIQYMGKQYAASIQDPDDLKEALDMLKDELEMAYETWNWGKWAAATGETLWDMGEGEWAYEAKLGSYPTDADLFRPPTQH
jgi:hypothetical protein